MRDGATVTAADVARLAGVGRAAVSNWRRRYEDFPEPVAGTASSPLFSLAAIEGWLRSQGKLHEEVPAEERLWQRIRAAIDDLRLAEAIADIGAFLRYLQQSPDDWAALARRSDREVAERLPAALAAEHDDLPGTPPGPFTPEFTSLLRAAADLASAWGASATFEFLCERYLEAHSRWTATTPGEVADLMAALADVRQSVVLDPACGTGTLLLASLPYAPAHLAGQERDEASARIATVRVVLRQAGGEGAAETATAGGATGTKAAGAARATATEATGVRRGGATDIVAGDSLREDVFPELRADAVLCNPPFNERDWGYEELAADPRWAFGLPPRGEPELAWVQHGLARTRPGGRVIMLVPAAVASRRSGRRLRAELLRSGALRAVVALPAGAAALSTAAPHLWLLRRPEQADPLPSHVLMVDVSAPGGSWAVIRETVDRSWRAYLGDGGAPAEEGVSAAIALIDLLDDEVDLTPARHVPRTAADAGADYACTRDRLAATVAELARTIPDFAAFDGDDGEGAPPTMTTLGEQAKAGALAIHQSPLRMESDAGELPLLTAQDAVLGRSPTGRVSSVPGLVTLRAGDIVVPAVARRVVARVITEGGGVLGPHLYLVRADPERYDPDFLAGFLRIAGRASATRSQSGASRIDVRRARFPRVPLAQQRGYGAAFRQLAALEDTLGRTRELGDTLVRTALDGLDDGSLRPGE